MQVTKKGENISKRGWTRSDKVVLAKDCYIVHFIALYKFFMNCLGTNFIEN